MGTLRHGMDPFRPGRSPLKAGMVPSQTQKGPSHFWEGSSFIIFAIFQEMGPFLSRALFMETWPSTQNVWRRSCIKQWISMLWNYIICPQGIEYLWVDDCLGGIRPDRQEADRIVRWLQRCQLSGGCACLPWRGGRSETRPQYQRRDGPCPGFGAR